MNKQYVVGVDIGGQSAKIGIVDREGKIVKRAIIPTKQPQAYQFIDLLASTINELLQDIGFENIKGVGVGAPSANYYTGEMVNASNVVWGKNQVVNLAHDLSKSLNGLSVTITNDANAAALGEKMYGVAKDMHNYIYITLGTGVGSGIVIDDKLVYGSDGFAGELGHTCAVKNGRDCGCGLKGCLETYCSASGVARTASEMLLKEGVESLLMPLYQEGKEITSKDVFDAAEKGDKLAIDIFRFTGNIMGEKFADFIPFSAPEAIILFGGLSKAQKYFMPHLLKSLNENVVFLWRDKVKVLISSLNESDAAILGASALAW